MLDFLVGLTFSFLIAFVAYKKASLNKSGCLAATVLGTGIYYFGGLWFSIIMISFFISSSILTKFKNNNKESLEKLNEKGGKRDYMQVFANGGVGLIISVLYYFYQSPVFLLAYAVSFAEATADTWASEVGVLSKSKPINILNFKPLEKGMSGGISILGTTFAFLGASFISFIYFIASVITYRDIKQSLIYSILCLVIGFIGSIVDSILGASVQAQYYCEDLKTITEKKEYKGKPNKLIKGIAFINNDMVNLNSNLISTLIVFILVNIRSWFDSSLGLYIKS